MHKIKLEYCCFLNSSGYGQAAQDYVLALEQSGKYDIRLNIFGGRPARPAVSDERYQILMKMKNTLVSDDRIQILHCIPTIQRRIKNRLKKNIGFATYETFEPPEEWVRILNKNDALVAPSNFNYRIFAHTKIRKPIFYIPHSVDIDLYHKDVKSLRIFNKFTFLFIGAWKERKGYIQLLEAWFKEFTEDDNVQLLIKTDKVKQAEDYLCKIKKQMGITKGFAPVLLESQVFDEKTMPRFLKSFNCLISPTAGEGFCLPGLQCMALGVPVIITDFSGCQDYANQETATLLKPEGFILKRNMDGIPQFRNKKWAFLTVQEIRKNMRYILNNSDEIKIKSQKAYDFVRENFNYAKVENYFSEMIGHLYG